MSTPKQPQGPLNDPQQTAPATSAEPAAVPDAPAENAAAPETSALSSHEPAPLPSWDEVCSVDPDNPVHPDLAGYYAAVKGEQAQLSGDEDGETDGVREDERPVEPVTGDADTPSSDTPAGDADGSSGAGEEHLPAIEENGHSLLADTFNESGLVIAPQAQEETTGADNGKDEDEDDDAEDDEEDAEDEADRPMTLKDHFLELRKRLTLVFFCAVLGFIVCYPFSQQIFDILVVPLKAAMPDNSSFVFTAPGEGFFTNLKVAFVAGLFLSSPLIFYQIWAFIAPGLYETEKRHILPVAFFSALFFISGGMFCYFIAFPFAFDFFMAYATGDVKAMLSLSETLSFILQLLLAFGIIFELPLFVFFLARLGLVTADWMRSMRRYAILVNVVVAALLTPPDVMSQMLMAAPLLLLYEISILVAATFGRKKKAEPAEEPGNEDTEETDETSS